MSETDLVVPEGQYAIVECFGHSTLVGRFVEVERFGTKMLSIEPIYRNELLPARLVGGAAIYAFTEVSGEVAFERQAKSEWDLPISTRCTIPAPLLEAPDSFGDEPPSFLVDEEAQS